MADTKADLEARVAALEADNERLRDQVAAAGASPARVTFPTRPAFGLSEGERQALEVEGVTNSPFTGERLLASDHGVDVITDAGRARLAKAQAGAGRGGDREGIEGVDYVYPSASPGVLADDAPVRGAVGQ